jgi:hypothetical protein
MIRRLTLSAALFLPMLVWSTATAQEENKPPKGFTALFNGKDLGGWHGEQTMSPAALAAMTEDERAAKLAAWKTDAEQHWSVKDGELVNDGKGVYLSTDKQLSDIELWVDYLQVPGGDSGIYLRGTPQVQIWDPEANARNSVGSGGLFNNQKNPSNPLVRADKPVGEWNRFRILQVGSRTSVWLNGKQVVDHTIHENYWDRGRPLFPAGPVQLQTHGGVLRLRNIFVREIPADEANALLASKGDEGFQPLFDGKTLTGWSGAVDNYEVKDGAIMCKPGKGGVLHTADEYGDFVVRLEIKLPEGGNNGLAIRYPGQGDCAYSGMCELQVLDNESPKYAKLDPRQYHGSAYGMVAAPRGYQRPAGDWNFQEVTVKGSTIKVELNGYVILDTDLSKVTEYMGGRAHPGKDLKQGFFGFAGHSDPVQFRNVRVKKLTPAAE